MATNTIFFPQMIRKTTVAFADGFNNIYINERQKNSSIKARIVPIKSGTDSKIIDFIKSLTQEHKVSVPVIGFVLTSIDFDENRVMNPINKIFDNNNIHYVFQPIPYSYTFDLGLYAKDYTDLFNIFEWISSQYTKARYYPLIEFKFLDDSEIQRDLPIELVSSSLDFNNEELTADSERILKINITFLVKGWIYRPIVVSGSVSQGDYDEATNVPNDISGSISAKVIQEINIDFENWYEKVFETYQITEDTGDEIVTTVTGNV